MNKKKIILGSGIFVAVIIAMILIWTNFGAKPVEGSKQVTIKVVNEADESKVYELMTDAEYLQQIMEEAKEDGLTYVCENGMVLTVNGENAIWEEDHAYWSILVNGEYGQYGIAEQPVKDGDVFEIVYTEAQ